MTKYIAYFRVSTTKQGQSGLGLEAQQSAVESFCEPLELFTEIETGTSKRQRPELQRAIAACKCHKATLVIAKLDRLARNVHFISGLMESGIEFVALDMPTANRFTIHILAAVAEHEATLISERTKAALQAAKKRGVVLGNPRNLTSEVASKGNAANVVAAERHTAEILPVARKLRDDGRTLQEIADILTGRGLLTRRGGKWSHVTVARLLAA